LNRVEIDLLIRILRESVDMQETLREQAAFLQINADYSQGVIDGLKNAIRLLDSLRAPNPPGGTNE
jgi:hypothetical protein